ncbi:DUF3800 domain-containing protein [Paenibacillus sp. FSL R7-0340]|uniref:DUF3800 domain-containing protein n=1 Tax=Paenibacillus sp. FSL R7-0340 TaxID=2921684 RepID=UPI0030FA6FF1
MEVDWKSRPKIIEYWPDGVDYVMGMDESGTADLVSISRKMNTGKEHEIDFTMKDFTLTGVIVDKNRYDELKKAVNAVKFKYWENGLSEYKGVPKRVCFHSRDIRKKSAPFNTLDPVLFTTSITEMIQAVDAKIISCHIDKLAHYKKYTTPIHPYHLSAQFILERFCNGLNEGGMTGIVMLESRGKKEDQFVLDYIVKIIEEGTNANSPRHFRNIAGVYFNPKWWENDNSQSSFVILEYADLVCFPIHKQHRGGDLSKGNPSYDIVEKKLYKYPRHNGWGLKIWRP